MAGYGTRKGIGGTFASDHNFIDCIENSYVSASAQQLLQGASAARRTAHTPSRTPRTTVACHATTVITLKINVKKLIAYLSEACEIRDAFQIRDVNQSGVVLVALWR